MDVCSPEACRGQDRGTLERRISHVLHDVPSVPSVKHKPLLFEHANIYFQRCAIILLYRKEGFR